MEKPLTLDLLTRGPLKSSSPTPLRARKTLTCITIQPRRANKFRAMHCMERLGLKTILGQEYSGKGRGIPQKAAQVILRPLLQLCCRVQLLHLLSEARSTWTALSLSILLWMGMFRMPPFPTFLSTGGVVFLAKCLLAPSRSSLRPGLKPDPRLPMSPLLFRSRLLRPRKLHLLSRMYFVRCARNRQPRASLWLTGQSVGTSSMCCALRGTSGPDGPRLSASPFLLLGSSASFVAPYVTVLLGKVTTRATPTTSLLGRLKVTILILME